MARIINKNTPEITASRRALGVTLVTIVPKHFYFPKQTAFLAGIDSNKFIHFINDGKYWAFIVNDDPDGFPVNANKGYLVQNRSLVGMFYRSTGRKGKCRFYIHKTKALHNGCPVYEISQETVEEAVAKQKALQARKNYVLNLPSPKSKGNYGIQESA